MPPSTCSRLFLNLFTFEIDASSTVTPCAIVSGTVSACAVSVQKVGKSY